MPLPVVYNVESVRARWRTSVVAVLGIAGAVGVFVAMLALAKGFRAALVESGSAMNAIVRRAGATSEIDSAVTLTQQKVIEDALEVAHGPSGPLVSHEAVVIAAVPLRETGTDANVQVRGVTEKARLVHENVALREGRWPEPGLFELVVGKNAAASYRGVGIGDTLKLGGAGWKVVGVMDAGDTAFDSEIWCDLSLLNPVYHRPQGVAQSVVARLRSPEALEPFRQRLVGDPRMKVQVDRETDYYAKASQMMTTLVNVLGTLVAAVMGVGAVFAALNTMYSAVAERRREVATIKALGFGGSSIVLSFTLEALVISLLGGLLGCALVLPINGLTTSTMNFQTFSHLAFAFRITPPLLAYGLGFALLMGLVGGVPPAVRAARQRIAVALREL
jgi:putative ABC transport system permease protein